jgi:DNA-binding NtrC family response regulator
MGSRILVVEDDDDMRRALCRCLQREGCTVVEAQDGRQAVEKLDGGLEVDLVVTDLEMPRADGREVLAAGTRRRIPVVILTGQASVSVAVELMQKGAANFLTKPFSPSTVRGLLEDAFGKRVITPAAKSDKAVVGRAAPFQRILDVIDTVAETSATVLISGESGTGKEVVARAIHAASPRAKGPFVAVNCGAIPEALLESELFGHAKGSFTGATHARAGRFQLAAGGTLFLDEIGDMPLAFQVKLLRVLQERQFEVLGEGVSRAVDVRVITATHRDLRKLVSEGKFREDLFYRLDVVELRLPALRERSADIPLLVEHFVALANARHGRDVSGATVEVLEAFSAYDWPGNVRELGNTIERMVIFRRTGLLQAADLPSQLVAGAADPDAPPALKPLPPEGVNLRALVEGFEDSLIAQALARTGGNRKAAADLLGLNRTTLVEKLKRKT